PHNSSEGGFARSGHSVVANYVVPEVSRSHNTWAARSPFRPDLFLGGVKFSLIAKERLARLRQPLTVRTLTSYLLISRF
ncbi:MAG TPA: hypothetical protein V6C84_31040, partial [Coleofasciculaceae cyanobacterium]